VFDRYMICEDTLRNVEDGGVATGFELEVRMPYYRGLGLSMVEDIELTVDGERVAREALRFGVRGRAYSLDQMEDELDERWEFGERAT
jgi:hypothetical protein